MQGDGVLRRHHHRTRHLRARQKSVMRFLVPLVLLDMLCPLECRSFGRVAGASLAQSFGALEMFRIKAGFGTIEREHAAGLVGPVCC